MILLLAATLLAGCAATQQVSFQSGGMTHTFSAGKDATRNGFLLPIYPQAKPTGAVSSTDAEESSSFLMLTSTDPVKKIGAFYRDELKNSGWTVEQAQFQDDFVNLSAKKEKLEASILISSEKDKSSITLTVGREPEGEPVQSKENFVPDKLNPPTD